MDVSILEKSKGYSAKKLMPLVRHGAASVLLEEDGRIKGVMSADIVNATLDEAWGVLMDFEHYSKFLPGITKSKVVSRADDKIKAKFTITVKVMGIGGHVNYFYEYRLDKPRIDVYNIDKGHMGGYWEIISTDDPDKVILLHSDVVKDVRSMHMFLRFLIDKIPTAEIALHVAPVVMLVKGLKKRMETVHRKSKRRNSA